jgi:glycosyltransferase involved in cell wall biosynthesis
MTDSPAVSVIVPAWGVGALLGEALGSLQAQTRSDWEAIVVDDGDTQAVADALAPFRSDPRIRLLATENGGLAAARNRGIAAARAPRICLLDGDDRYRPDYLEKMIAALDADPRLGFVTCDAQLFGAPRFEGKLFSQLEPQTGPLTLERVLRRQFKVFGSTMMRREALGSVGGFDAGLRSAEDLDLWIRMLGGGWSAAYVPAPLVEYRRRATSLSADALGLARWVCRVYENAVARLDGQPEQSAAAEMLAVERNKLRIEEGEAAILEGRTRAGLALLRSTDIASRSLKWRLAMTLFRIVPPLAGPVIRAYTRRQPFS